MKSMTGIPTYIPRYSISGTGQYYDCEDNALVALGAFTTSSEPISKDIIIFLYEQGARLQIESHIVVIYGPFYHSDCVIRLPSSSYYPVLLFSLLTCT